MYNRKNLANAIVASASGTTITVEFGNGSILPEAPFYATASPMGVVPSMANSEIVLVTDKTGDTLTVVRAKRGTTQQGISTGWVIGNGVYTEDVEPVRVTVSTAAASAAKVGTTDSGNYVPTAGDKLLVVFVNGTSVDNPTLNIDGSGAKNIRLGSVNVGTTTMGVGNTAGSKIEVPMWYDGTYYKIYGSHANNTYSVISEAEIASSTSTTGRLISGQRLQAAVADRVRSNTTQRITVSDTEPASPTNGDIWIDSGGPVGNVGDIIMTLNSSPSSGRLFMDGGTHNKSDYPFMWEHIVNNPAYGTTTDTTFTLADMRERMPFGKSDKVPWATLGYKAGTQTETLTINQIPSHSHTQRAYFASSFTGGAPDLPIYYGRGGSGLNNSFDNINATGGGKSHNNMPPVIVVNYEVVSG